MALRNVVHEGARLGCWLGLVILKGFVGYFLLA